MKNSSSFVAVLLFILFVLSGQACKKGEADNPVCNNFPGPLGEKWTYRVLGNGYVFSVMTEPVDSNIGGHKVYRWRRDDSPPALGDYIGCDPEYGKVWVASDSWFVAPPHNPTREVFDKPIPWDLCPYGTPVGTKKDNSAFVGYDDRSEVEVLAYEDVTVPAGTYKNVQKIKVAIYLYGKVDEDLVPYYEWYDEHVGLVKALEVDPGPEIGYVLTAHKEP